MGLDRIILDLQDKVLKLSDEVADLRQEVEKLKTAPMPTATTPVKADKATNSKIRGSLNKKDLVTAVRRNLADKIPVKDILKGTRKEGSGIVIAKGDRKLKLSLRGSGFYGKDDVSPRMQYTGFSTISKKTIYDVDGQFAYDFFVFAVNHSDDPDQPAIDFFVFDQPSFQRLLDAKTPSGKNAMYYFYFGQTVDGHYIDDRERDTELILDADHDAWDRVVAAYDKL